MQKRENIQRKSRMLPNGEPKVQDKMKLECRMER